MRTNRIQSYVLPLFVAATAAWFCVPAIGGEEPRNRAGVTAGQKAPAFQARTLDGKTVKFPEDYRGKVVLLDFWATWCGPCRQELPNVISAYRRYHTNGFEVLSVSLDKPREGPKVVEFARTNSLTWPQIYDGGYWQTPTAVSYGIRAIPCPVLVDGDTGIILAEGVGAIGPRLAKVLRPALAAKAGK